MTSYKTMAALAAPDWDDPKMQARLKRRHRGATHLRFAGVFAIAVALGLLTLLLGSIFSIGLKAFSQTVVRIDVPISVEYIDESNIADSNWTRLAQDGVATLFPDDATGRRDQRYRGILSRGGIHEVRQAVEHQVTTDPSMIGASVSVTVQLSDPYDQLAKGVVRRDTPEETRRLSGAQIAMYDALVAEGRVDRVFNRWLFTNGDSRFPEMAGLAAGLMGSAMALTICLLIAFPVGIATAIYLEEFAPKNWLTNAIEVNINNLAAVPSIIFGLLGLAVFLNFFGLPRSAPLVGGLVLALMTLPTIIIATRAALKAVPPSIREGAMGIGASRVQVVFHHVLPLAMPGILTGTIVGLAQALGETAPLLLIGMNMFSTDLPGGVFDQATALPTQIFMWFDSPELGFISRTAAAIIVLLAFLLVMNATAIFLRAKLERKW